VPHLAPTGLLEVPGFRAMGMKCGIKKDRPDLMMLVSDQEGTTGAAMFTQNAFAAAPVHISRQHVANGDVRAVVCNSGNANACTGRQGLRNALRMARETADLLGLEPEQVLVCSTGIIGREMPMDLISAGIKNGIKNLSAGGIGEAARAILTTDSGPKEATATFTHDGIEYHLAGFAKGAGMIHPNLATMLAFVLTDAPVPADDLRAALKHAVDHTFNQISVDGDESTNDTVIVLANGAAGGKPLAKNTPGHKALQDALTGVCERLARRIAADGEGAERLLEVQVEGAATPEAARLAARAVVRRVLAAIGSTRVAVKSDEVSLWLESKHGSVCVVDKGEPLAAALGEGHRILDAPEVRIRVQLASGKASGVALGCDLSEDYVKFNAAYST
jgi:glutamate N-acetyltransferase / amino-acid N-acetyltransferase